MEEREVTFTDVWYKYIVPFFKEMFKSLKRTFTSKRLVFLLIFVLGVPLLMYGINLYELKENDGLVCSQSRYTLVVDKTKITIPTDSITGAPLLSPESYALVVAEEQAQIAAKVIYGNIALEKLYEDAEIKEAAKCLLDEENADFLSRYSNYVGTDGNVTKDFFVSVMPNYIIINNNQKGMFTVKAVSNIENGMIYEQSVLASTEGVNLNFYKNYAANMSCCPTLTREFVGLIGNGLEKFISEELNTVMLNEFSVDYISKIVTTSSAGTQDIVSEVFTVKPFGLKDAALGVLYGVIATIVLFWIIDGFKAINRGEKKYREKV